LRIIGGCREHIDRHLPFSDGGKACEHCDAAGAKRGLLIARLRRLSRCASAARSPAPPNEPTRQSQRCSAEVRHSFTLHGKPMPPKIFGDLGERRATRCLDPERTRCRFLFFDDSRRGRLYACREGGLFPGWRVFPGYRMSRIFISHSSENNVQAIALSRWLEQEGWNDVFLDLDPERGLKPGERWEHALREAAGRCEAIVFLVSRAWLKSEWCRDEFRLARHLLKRLFGVLIEDIPKSDLPAMLTREWQVVSIAPDSDVQTFSVNATRPSGPAEVAFSSEGLRRLRAGLFSAGLDARFFAWPPPTDPDRPPYRGLPPLEAEDAGIFLGRDGPIVEALDRLRGLRESTPPRLLIILGASGAGKSSFLRAGLFPRLARDDRNFLPLPVLRPERAAINGDVGLLAALQQAFNAASIPTTRAKLRAAVEAGAGEVAPLLQALLDKVAPSAPYAEIEPKTPTLIIAIDQGEELLRAEGRDESQKLLALLRDLLLADAPALIVLLTIRSDSYGQLQEEPMLDGIAKIPFDLSPMPKGSYAEVIKGPARRLAGTKRALKIEDALPDALLTDIEAGGAKDALPLLAFTLERLYVEHGGDGDLTVAEYRSLGGIKGSIEAAVERALKAADSDAAVPNERAARLEILRRGLIPWLAGIDPDNGLPRRRVARLSEIPPEARSLIQHLVEQRLLATDVDKQTGQATIEPAHEALLRQWGLLNGWLTEDAALLAVLEGVKRASRDWAANNRDRAWLTHQTYRLGAAARLSARADFAANLEPTDSEYIAACRKAEADAKRARRLLQIATYASLVAVIIGLVGWIKQKDITDEWRWHTVTLPYAKAQVRPYVMSAAKEQALNPGDSFKECAQDCPEMIVVPAGSYMMGAPATDREVPGFGNEIPRHEVTVAKPFAVSKYVITFADWDACVTGGGCNGYHPNDEGWGRGRQPVINVNWEDAHEYVAWLSAVTGKTYRLLSESEYEYTTRAGTATAYPWGDDLGANNANCDGCSSKWDNTKTAPVGSFAPNKFGLYDAVGNVWKWTDDCVHGSYNGAPTDGLAWMDANEGDCKDRVVRGGSWYFTPVYARSAYRYWLSILVRYVDVGFRVVRTLP
jgi:formylglycine-generating enzyme required for sulfatase activity